MSDTDSAGSDGSASREQGGVGGPVDAAMLVSEALESTSDGVLLLDREWRFLYLNENARVSIGQGRELLGKNVWEEFPAAAGLRFWTEYHRAMEQRVPVSFESYYPAPIDAWFEMQAYPTASGISVFFRDVTKKKAAEVRLRLLEQAVAAAPMGISIAEYREVGDCPLIYVNPAFEALTGYEAGETLGQDCRFLQGEDNDQNGKEELQAGIRAGRSTRVMLRNYKKNGQQFFNEVHLSPVQDEQGQVTHLVGIQNDVTGQLETKDRLAKQAQYDALTGLANRYLLMDRLRAAVALARTLASLVGVVIVDLDNFKHLNDRFGHMEADRILVQITRRLKIAVEPGDTVARLGGDEFAVILALRPDQGRIQKCLERLLMEIQKPLMVSGSPVLVTASLGAAVFPEDSLEAGTLMQMADLAMYSAKRFGKNSFRFYSPELRANNNEPLDVAVGFRRALAQQEFELYYQARVGTGENQVVGFEALIRWNHPERGLLLPAQFVRIAEDTGLIHEIGAWVLREALRQNAQWRAAGYRPVTMSVNVSPAQIRDPQLARFIAEALEETGLPADSLELELTESLVIDNPEVAEASLRALRRLGVRIAIDDFGSGYSGLQYLSRFPIDIIKIDHYFVRNIATDRAAATICQSVLKLGVDLGLTTVAEGVEGEEQAVLLQEWNCSEMQGFLFGRAEPEARARARLGQAG